MRKQLKTKKHSFYYSIFREITVLSRIVKIIVVINNNNSELNYPYHLTTGMKSRKIISR